MSNWQIVLTQINILHIVTYYIINKLLYVNYWHKYCSTFVKLALINM